MSYINPFSFATAEALGSEQNMWRLSDFIAHKHHAALTDESEISAEGLLTLPDVLIRPLHTHTRMNLGSRWHNLLRDLTSVFFTQQCQALTGVDLGGSVLSGELGRSSLPLTRDFLRNTRMVLSVPISYEGEMYIRVNTPTQTTKDMQISLTHESSSTSALLLALHTDEECTLTLNSKGLNQPPMTRLFLWWEDHTPIMPYSD